MQIVSNKIVMDYLNRFYCGDAPLTECIAERTLAGEFAYKDSYTDWDFYGSVDIIFTLYVMGLLYQYTDENSREQWAKKILSCQDENGYFTKKNATAHGKEHATAYAISGLILLSKDTNYIQALRPCSEYVELIKSKAKLTKFIDKMGLRFPQLYKGKGLYGSLKKSSWHLGWHNIWPASHIGGGALAAIQMSQDLYIEAGLVSKEQMNTFFENAVSELNTRVDAKTGLWKKGFHDLFIKDATVRDVGGAAHFFWIYDALKADKQSKIALIKSCLRHQTESGLLKEKPYCIDFDFVNILCRAYFDLPEDQQKEVFADVNEFIGCNYKSVATVFEHSENLAQYDNSHGFPGALCTLAEAQKFGVGSEDEMIHHPFDSVCWL
jgi:hypothetical protein